uniref:AAA_9 domain-containing protein n=1 Tax=Angiostrongylus cantonensis TaxID=6313 RepID=A0A0K0D089_ANGCA
LSLRAFHFDGCVLFPGFKQTIQRALIPLELSNELQYMSELKLELVNRFQESPFFLDNIQVKDIRRYTDKYNEIQRERLEPGELV